MVPPAPEVVERNVGARIREVRAHVMQSRAAQSGGRGNCFERRERARAPHAHAIGGWRRGLPDSTV
jgi:hypothetical protein